MHLTFCLSPRNDVTLAFDRPPSPAEVKILARYIGPRERQRLAMPRTPPAPEALALLASLKLGARYDLTWSDEVVGGLVAAAVATRMPCEICGRSSARARLNLFVVTPLIGGSAAPGSTLIFQCAGHMERAWAPGEVLARAGPDGWYWRDAAALRRAGEGGVG